MKKKRSYRSIYDIKIAKERLRYETRLNKEKLKISSNYVFSDLSLSLKNLGANIRNRLLAYSIVRSYARSKLLFTLVRNLVRGFRQTR
jgi:hypothetical protein